MTKVSVMTLTLWEMLEDGRLTDSVMLERIEEAGFDGVELSLERLMYKPRILGIYREYLSWSKLDVTCIDAISNLASPDPVKHREAVDTLRTGIEAAAELRCPLVLSAGSTLERGACPKESRKRIIEGLCACVDQAKAAGVTLAIEDFGVVPKLQCAAADCLEVLDGVPGLKFVFDTGNFYLAGEDPRDNFDRLAPRTTHVHLKDWARTDTPEFADVSCARLDSGLVPNEDLIHRFVAAGIDHFSIESGVSGDRLDAAIHDLRQVRTWLDQA